MDGDKKVIFCVKCGRKSGLRSMYCANCGQRLIKPKTGVENNDEINDKNYEENKITLENMSLRISEAVFIVAKVITKSSMLSPSRPKQPTTKDMYSTEVFVILNGEFNYVSDVVDQVKKKILKEFGTDINISDVKWMTRANLSSGLRDKGWNTAFDAFSWYMWPSNGSTVKTLITIKYVNGVSKRKIIKGDIYTQDRLEIDKKSEIWEIVIIVAACCIFYILYLLSK
jgi:hypothetical protein